MNVENLKRKHLKLIAFMESSGYSKEYIARVRREINRILAKADAKGWIGYGDVYRDYLERSDSKSSIHQKRVILGLIERFEVYGQYPNQQQRQHQLIQRGKYHLLIDEFKKIIDYYCDAEKSRGIKDSTIYGNSSNAANFLFTLQEKGIKTLEAITEKDVLSVFLSPDGDLCRCYGYKKNIAAVLKTVLPQESETVSKILSFLPAIKNSRKNIKYLLPDEIGRIKQVLNDEYSTLSLRNKAIGILALYTGLRSCDIAGLRISKGNYCSGKLHRLGSGRL